MNIMKEGQISTSSQQVLNVFLTVTVTQLTLIVFLLGEDLFRGTEAIIHYFKDQGDRESFLPERRKFISQMAWLTALIPFSGFVYGISKGKYNFKVLKETLYFEDLPSAFDGFTITQISDIHSGSFNNPEEVKKGIELAKSQNSDLFVFTGDLVNHKAEEIEPYISGFSEIESRYGKFSILGNHDYGDYISWPSPEAKAKNFENLKSQHHKIGCKLLLDEHVVIRKEGQEIKLLGVENWGVGFKSKGDLNKAMKGINDSDFKILLSHDPSHWDREVKTHASKIHLTLSGHTHGMQFGIETRLGKWSPAQYRYPNWAGLAEKTGRYLYVNRGFGFHAFAGRVGIWPEITVIELKKKV